MNQHTATALAVSDDTILVGIIWTLVGILLGALIALLATRTGRELLAELPTTIADLLTSSTKLEDERRQQTELTYRFAEELGFPAVDVIDVLHQFATTGASIVDAGPAVRHSIAVSHILDEIAARGLDGRPGVPKLGLDAIELAAENLVAHTLAAIADADHNRTTH
jgi:hypothetical protein